MNAARCHRRPSRVTGYTLVEMLISMAIFTVAGGGLYTFIRSWNELYVRNFALNDTEITVRAAVDRITRELEAAAGPPTLLDQAGNAVAVNNATQGGVAIGTVGLGVRFNRQNTSGAASAVAFWAVPNAAAGKSELRFYPNGFSATSANYVVLARNLLTPSDMTAATDDNQKFDYPFQFFRFKDTQRCLGVNLRARAGQYDRYIATTGSRVDPTAFEEFNTFFQLRTVVAYRSPVLTDTVITDNGGATGP